MYYKELVDITARRATLAFPTAARLARLYSANAGRALVKVRKEVSQDTTGKYDDDSIDECLNLHDSLEYTTVYGFNLE